MAIRECSWIGCPLRKLPNEIIIQAQKDQQRPTIRAFPFEPGHKTHQRVVSYLVAPNRLRDKNKSLQVFTTVGGGVDKGFDWISALERELSQELGVRCVTPSALNEATVLALETVPTTRAGLRGKLVVVVGLPVNKMHLEAFRPTREEIIAPSIGTISETATRLRGCHHTSPEMAAVYRSALSTLRKCLSR